jgi:UDP:flavonoid glycosyltransferase YjiC (YdhE family)
MHMQCHIQNYDTMSIGGNAGMAAASLAGLDTSFVTTLEPESIHHVDRDSKAKAAKGFKWALLEFLLVASCDAAITSSGFGTTAAAIGGVVKT